VQGGDLRQFSATALLIQLTTSLALFAMATVLTDFAALYLLPDARVYCKVQICIDTAVAYACVPYKRVTCVPACAFIKIAPKV
jgi:hypothetical protein